MEGGAEALDGGMASDQGIGHGVARGIGIEATVDCAALGEQRRQPAWVGRGAGGGGAGWLSFPRSRKTALALASA